MQLAVGSVYQMIFTTAGWDAVLTVYPKFSSDSHLKMLY